MHNSMMVGGYGRIFLSDEKQHKLHQSQKHQKVHQRSDAREDRIYISLSNDERVYIDPRASQMYSWLVSPSPLWLCLLMPTIGFTLPN